MIHLIQTLTNSSIIIYKYIFTSRIYILCDRIFQKIYFIKLIYVQFHTYAYLLKNSFDHVNSTI